MRRLNTAEAVDNVISFTMKTTFVSLQSLNTAEAVDNVILSRGVVI